jgi:hypothetical protein
MRQPRTYLYQLLKTSWGIWIMVAAQASLQEAVDVSPVKLSLPVWITFEGLAAELPQVYKQELSKGLAAVAAEASEKVGGQPVTVSVLEISYQECDFQTEGLSVAMLRWVEEEFGLARRDIGESYDRNVGRYVFDWR